MANEHLTPTQAARRLGVTPKALRLYERHGLVAPVRAGGNGYRTYGPVEMARLHQVLALKTLGLPLARIASFIGGRLGSLDTILDLQQRVLRREAKRVTAALALVAIARARLKAGETLSVDDLSNLTKETTMTVKADPDELETIFKPLIEKNFTQADLAEISARKNDHPDAAARWQELMAEAETLMASGDPTTPQAMDLAERWQAMVDAFTGGDPATAAKVKAVWTEAFADPAAAPRLPASPAIFGFIHQALMHRRALERNAPEK